jgi:hypothetical protein
MKKSSHTHSLLWFGIRACKSRRLLQLCILVTATCFFALGASAQKIEMMKIVYRRVDPAVKPDSVESEPRTLYRAGDKYLRREELANPAEQTHILQITREPEAWVINLMDHTAQHIVDPGPTFNVRAPIFWQQKPSGEPDPDRQLMGLEFGNEELFFRQNKARDLGTKKVDGKECKVFAIKSGGSEVTLFLDAETNKPVQIEAATDGKPISYRYLSYETDLPFQPALFEPPSGLKITEQSASVAATPTPSPKK